MKKLAFIGIIIIFLAACSTSVQVPEAPLPTEFPNEEGVLISPEGQRIIDAVAEGRLDAPELLLEPLELDELSTQGVVPWFVSRPFYSSMGHFWYYRSIRSPSFANWSTDVCSNSLDRGVSFDFRKPCIRHDYGYRNWKDHSAFTSSAKEMIDERFLSDMKAHCGTRSFFLKPTCYSTAYTYYAAVSLFG